MRIKPDPGAINELRQRWEDPAYMQDTRVKREILMLIGIIDWQLETIEFLKLENDELRESAHIATARANPHEIAAVRRMLDSGKRVKRR